jgi:hypothetical protein
MFGETREKYDVVLMKPTNEKGASKCLEPDSWELLAANRQGHVVAGKGGSETLLGTDVTSKDSLNLLCTGTDRSQMNAILLTLGKQPGLATRGVGMANASFSFSRSFIALR